MAVSSVGIPPPTSIICVNTFNNPVPESIAFFKKSEVKAELDNS